MMDPISDMLTRIRNATRAGHPEVVVPFSNFKKKIAEIMKKKGFIESVSEEGEGKRKFLKIILKYSRDERGKQNSVYSGASENQSTGTKNICRQEPHSGCKERLWLCDNFNFKRTDD